MGLDTLHLKPETNFTEAHLSATLHFSTIVDSFNNLRPKHDPSRKRKFECLLELSVTRRPQKVNS